MAVMTAVNLLSARAYGEFEFWFSSIKVTAIVAFILVAAAHAFGVITPDGAEFLQPVRARRICAERLARDARRRDRP